MYKCIYISLIEIILGRYKKNRVCNMYKNILVYINIYLNKNLSKYNK